ncbi:MAG TPA: YceI family protein [Opitutus sp.]|nr:YceI family protein [Opitutus sp.]
MKPPVRLLALASLALGLIASASAAVETYQIDPVHSSVAFSIRHFFTPVPGMFTKFNGTIVVDRDDLEKSTVEATIEAASVNTRNDRRDGDLRSDRFFSAAQFPTITFKSTSWKKTGENTFDVAGDLTIKNVTKPVVLKVKSLGFGPGMRPGSLLCGWQATTTLNRNDFGIATMPKILGDDVEITIGIEGHGMKAGG